MTYNHDAIYRTHPNVVRIDDSFGAFDSHDNLVKLNYDKINAESIIIDKENKINRVKINRSMAYISESDPLFFKYQRGEVTREVWEAKIEEIRNRYP